MIKPLLFSVMFGVGCWQLYAHYPSVWCGVIGFAVMFGAMTNSELIMAAFMRHVEK